jgi:hypothetical protein
VIRRDRTASALADPAVEDRVFQRWTGNPIHSFPEQWDDTGRKAPRSPAGHWPDGELRLRRDNCRAKRPVRKRRFVQEFDAVPSLRRRGHRDFDDRPAIGPRGTVELSHPATVNHGSEEAYAARKTDRQIALGPIAKLNVKPMD